MGKAVRTGGALRGTLVRMRDANEQRYRDWATTRRQLIEEYERALREAEMMVRRPPEDWVFERPRREPLNVKRAYYAGLSATALVVTCFAFFVLLSGPRSLTATLVSIIAAIAASVFAARLAWRSAAELLPAIDTADREASDRRYILASVVVAVGALVLFVWLGAEVVSALQRAIERPYAGAYPSPTYSAAGSPDYTFYDGSDIAVHDVPLDELYRMRTRFKVDESIDARGPAFERLAAGVGGWRHNPNGMPPGQLQTLLGPPDWFIRNPQGPAFAYAYQDRNKVYRVIQFFYNGDDLTNVHDVTEYLFNPGGWSVNRLRQWDSGGVN
jgi:hypothetical protein